MASEHETWIVGLLHGLTNREHRELLGLLARVKHHALGIAGAKSAE